MSEPVPHVAEPHNSGDAAKLNWLRAGVLGANDGIVATAGLVIGVAASGAGKGALVTAGLAGLVSGAMSMAAGEYVSVSTQRDTEAAILDKERKELADFPEEELAELTDLYAAKGLDPQLARTVAEALTAHDALGAHAEAELKLDAKALTNPWQAAGASALAFTVGSAVPLLAILLVAGTAGIWTTVIAAALTLAATGWISADLGGAPRRPAILRNVGGGLALVGTRID